MSLAQVDERQVATRQSGAAVAEGKYVTLRRLRPEDCQTIAEWAQDADLRRAVGSELLDLDSEVREAALADPRQRVFMVTSHGYDQASGLVRLFNIHQDDGYAFFEMFMGPPVCARRTAFGVEAGELLAGYAFYVMGLRRIEAKVFAYNALSMNALKRHGFVEEGVLRHAAIRDGVPVDVVIFGMLHQDFEAERHRLRRRHWVARYPEVSLVLRGGCG